MLIPHGSDWSSIREAGMNAVKRGASPGDTASRDGYGYAQEGNKTAVTLNQRKRLRRWSQKALAKGPAYSCKVGIHPMSNPAEFTTLPPSSNRDRERSNPVRALRPRSNGRSRCQPQGVRGGIESEANVFR